VTLRSIAFSNLRRRRARAAFLVVGVLIGVATVVTLVSLMSAMRVEAQDRMEDYGANILITPRTDELALSYGGVSVGGVAVDGPELTEADVRRIRTIPDSDSLAVVAPVLLGSVEVERQRVLLMGARVKDEFALKRWWKVDGRAPRGPGELVAGRDAARALGLQMGDTVRVRGRAFTLTGILQPTGSQDDDLLLVDLDVAQDLLGRPGAVSLVEVAALCAGCPIEEIVAQLSAILPSAKVTAMQEVVESRLHALDQFRTMSLVVAGVVLVIEALVVFVTMMGSVSERTREIGIFRALGFRRGHVTRLILVEALLASALAGALGYLAGMGTTYAVLPFVGDGGARVVWVPLVALAAVAAAAAVGGVASLYPAVRASRLDPTEALRAL
jgi:putative ABC transport system permease protein